MRSLCQVPLKKLTSDKEFKEWIKINKEYLYKEYCSIYPEDFEDFARRLYRLDREVE